MSSCVQGLEWASLIRFISEEERGIADVRNEVRRVREALRIPPSLWVSVRPVRKGLPIRKLSSGSSAKMLCFLIFVGKHHRVPPMPKRTHPTKKIALQPNKLRHLLKSRSQWPPTHSPSVPLRRSVTLRTCGESLSRKSISLLLPSKSASQFRSAFTYDVCNVLKAIPS